VKTEKRILLEDVLGDARREATLLAGGRILRRRRWKRAATRFSVALAAVMLAAMAIHQKRLNPIVAQSVPAVPASPTVRVESLTDDELLALFPNTPVALISMADGRKRLVFLHPGDEAKFITRL
jgi:hypothetical protein